MINTTSPKGAVFPVDQNQRAAAEFGINPEAVRVITLALDTALVNFTIDVTGSVVWAFDATSLSASISMRLQTQANDKLTVKKGFFLGGVRFSHLIIDSVAQAGESVTLMIVKEQSDALRVVNPSADFTAVTVDLANTLATVADVTCNNAAKTLILAADATRRTALIRNPTGGGEIRVGDTNVAAARGVAVYAGEQITLEVTDDIYVYNNSGAAINVQITTISD